MTWAEFYEANIKRARRDWDLLFRVLWFLLRALMLAVVCFGSLWLLVSVVRWMWNTPLFF